MSFVIKMEYGDLVDTCYMNTDALAAVSPHPRVCLEHAVTGISRKCQLWLASFYIPLIYLFHFFL